jgi:hypothetical protein
LSKDNDGSAICENCIVSRLALMSSGALFDKKNKIKKNKNDNIV